MFARARKWRESFQYIYLLQIPIIWWKEKLLEIFLLLTDVLEIKGFCSTNTWRLSDAHRCKAVLMCEIHLVWLSVLARSLSLISLLTRMNEWGRTNHLLFQKLCKWPTCFKRELFQPAFSWSVYLTAVQNIQMFSMERSWLYWNGLISTIY